MKLFCITIIYFAVVAALVIRSFSERGRKGNASRIVDCVRRGILRNSRREQQRWLDAFIAGQPKVVRAFFEQDFVPANEEELAIFEKIQEAIAKGDTSFDDHHADFARIGSAELLDYLYNEHRKSSPEDDDIRKRVLRNPRCLSALCLWGLNDSSWQVRKDAVLHPNCPERFIKGRYEAETNRVVRAAIEQRLGIRTANHESASSADFWRTDYERNF